MASTEALQQIRARIDALDEQIQALLSERAICAQQVGVLKHAAGDRQFYRPEREAQVLRRVKERNRGPLSDVAVAQLFREIMSACLALEQPLKVAYLGPAGTFTQAAAIKHFGHAVDSLPLGAIDEVFREVEAGAVDFGVVPVENSTEGVVNHTLDMFLQSPLAICGEVQMSIHHQLLSHAADVAQIRHVYAHQQALAQCREWLDANLAGAERIAVSSNGEAARRLRDEACADGAAIAGQTAADLYELPVLAANIEDDPNNTTRFLVIGKQTIPPSGKDKTALLVAAPNRPGLLYRLLEPFARHSVNMTRIESRPSRRGVWDYVFFIDIEGHRDDPPVALALVELQQATSLFRILGSYPTDTL